MKEVINLEVTSYLSNIFNKGFNLGETTLCNTLTKDSSLLLTVRTMIDLIDSNKESFTEKVPVLLISKYPLTEIIELLANEIVKRHPEFDGVSTYSDVIKNYVKDTPFNIAVSQMVSLDSSITLGDSIRFVFIPEYNLLDRSIDSSLYLRKLRNHCSVNNIMLFLTRVFPDVRRFDLDNACNLDRSQNLQEVDRCVWVEMEEDSSGVTRAKARILKHRNPEPIPYEHIELMVDPSGSCLVNKSN